MPKGKTGIGIDIGTSAVRAAEVSLAKNPPSIQRFAQIPLPLGAVVDGEITDPAVVTEAIREVWKAGGFKSKSANLALANQKVVARTVEVPFMDEKELRGAIGFQIQEQVPIPIEDAVIDFQVIEEFDGEEGEKMLRVLVVAAVRDMVVGFIDAVEDANVRVDSVDFTPICLIRSLGNAGVESGGGEGEAIIDIGASITSIVVHEAGVTKLSRVLAVGGHDLTMALSDALGISVEEAENLKLRVGVSLNEEESEMVYASTGTDGSIIAGNANGGDSSAGGSEDVSESTPEQSAAHIVEKQVSELIDQIRGSLDYYLDQSPDARIGRVLLAGGTSKLLNLRSRMASALSLPVEHATPLRKLTLGAVLPYQSEVEPLMGACVGVAMGGIS